MDENSTHNNGQFDDYVIKVLRYTMLMFQFNYLRANTLIVMSNLILILHVLTFPNY